MKKTITAGLVIIAIFCSFAFADAGVPAMRYTMLYNNDIRRNGDNFYSARLEAFFTKAVTFVSRAKTAKAIPFVEQRYSVERQKRERTMAGIEFGIEPADFLYIGEQLRYSWYSEQLHRRGVIENTNMPESLTRITLSYRLIPGKDILKGYATGEYTYDFRNGRGVRMETIVGLLAPLGKRWLANLDWRHRDRIHDFDSDTFEGSLSYNF